MISNTGALKLIMSSLLESNDKWATAAGKTWHGGRNLHRGFLPNVLSRDIEIDQRRGLWRNGDVPRAAISLTKILSTLVQ
jgi:hypothetical protein